MTEKPVEGITDKRKIDEQVAAHETGHAVVGLAIGMQLRNIERIEGKSSDSYLSDSIKQTYITNFHVQKDGVEEHLSLLNTAAGMAGEALLSRKYYYEIGKDDVARLHHAGLNETQIKELILLGADVLKANHTFFEEVWNSMLDAMGRNQSELINGAPVTAHFRIHGKKFTDFAKLEKILTPGPK